MSKRLSTPHLVHITATTHMTQAESNFIKIVGQVPKLHSLIPRRRNDGGLESVGAETNARDPVLVRLLVRDSELAFSEGVPELDRAVTGEEEEESVRPKKSFEMRESLGLGRTLIFYGFLWLMRIPRFLWLSSVRDDMLLREFHSLSSRSLIRWS
ncbi:hypothetical protein CMV_019917 [Castanea mollissima]|uniref:Uncharacterized protein n=1 Tax=Castanea mollissima TaxID=60419 RepID=A0A8J4QMC6_9ROSI|nr:hypothetical protein CMV_019917 [Castanea mollissima]